MGNSAVQVQSQARPLGINSGQLDAFRLNVNRYTDADSLLQNTVDAPSDLSKLPQLMMVTGKSMSEIQSMSPDKLALELMHDADKWWNSTPPNQRNMQPFQVSGLAGIMSFDQVRALGSMTNDERADLDGDYAQDSKDFNVPTFGAGCRTRRTARGTGAACRSSVAWRAIRRTCITTSPSPLAHSTRR